MVTPAVSGNQAVMRRTAEILISAGNVPRTSSLHMATVHLKYCVMQPKALQTGNKHSK